jgi:regulator of RNase E activity RraB
MYRKIITTLAFASILTAGAFAATTTTKPQPKITMEQARVIALKKAPGTIKSEELENEHGKLIYSFDIATSKKDVTEVNVDAMNGKIVAVQHEDAAKEAAEKKQEEKEKPKKQ